MKRVTTSIFVAIACAVGCHTSEREPDEERAPETKGAVESGSEEAPELVGSSACAGCHREAYDGWVGSHHDRAMQLPTAKTVLGSFADERFEYFGEAIRFTEKGGRFFIEVRSGDGQTRKYEVEYVFGVEPLQQYLVETEPGRLQAFPVAWDSRPRGEGGQRWFHLQAEEHVASDDPLHWTGPSYNWNGSCADCHSTAVRKGYDRASKQYATEFAEIDVGCESCHGAGSQHVAAAKEGELGTGSGFERRLPPASARQWRFVEGRDIAVLSGAPRTDELEVCAPCHSRRAELGEDGGFHDSYRLSMLDPHLYFDDGQINDEVFVYGSFLQSKMHSAGVICSDCHSAHTAGVRAEGNALCSRCHRAEVFDGPQHHFHPAGSEGSACTSCHMPKRTYMTIDERGDHRFGIPRPALSEELGSPDPCTECHRGRGAAWAERQIAKRFPSRSPHGFAEAFHAARHHRAGAEAALVELVAAGEAPAIVRATALIELRGLGSRALPALSMQAASDSSPVVRRAAAEAVRDLPAEMRAAVAVPLLRDATRSVRIEAASTLLEINARTLRPADRRMLAKATAELERARSHAADRGDGLVDLARIALAGRQPRRAEAMLREAIDVDPTFTAAYVNLSDLYRASGRNAESEAVLRDAIDQAADPATVEHALGLALVRFERYDEATEHLRRAYELRPESIRFGYVYAVAQFDRGNPQAAFRALRALERRYPANVQILRLLSDYHRQRGRRALSARYAEKVEELESF